MGETRGKGRRRSLWLGVGGVALVLVVLFCPNPYWRERARAVSCASATQMTVVSTLCYADNHQGRLPSLAIWNRDQRHYAPGRMILWGCPDNSPSEPRTYAMVSRWSGVSLRDIPDPASAILLYEVDQGQPVFRHKPGYRYRYPCVFSLLREYLTPPGMYVGYVDGHVALRTVMTPEMIANGRDTQVK